MWTFLRLLGFSIFGYVLPRFLVGLGVPLDDWAVKLGQYVRGSQTMIDQEFTMTVVALASALLFMFAELWLKPVGRIIARFRRSPSAPKKEQDKQPEKPEITQKDVVDAPPTISLIDLMRDAERQDWQFTADGSQDIFKFTRALRDAGSTGSVTFWGRKKQRIKIDTESTVLSEIESGYWQVCKIDGMSCLGHSSDGDAEGIAADNFQTQTECEGNQFIQYADIYLDRKQALLWLMNEGSLRISLSDAVVKAYKETQGTITAMMAEQIDANIEDFYASAFQTNIDFPVFGKRVSRKGVTSRITARIPDDDARDFRFTNNANDLEYALPGRPRYTDLEIYKADYEKLVKILTGRR